MGKSKMKAASKKKSAVNPPKAKKPYNLIMPICYSRKYLNELYREAGFKDTESRMLRKVMKGFSNLTGTYPVKEIWDYLETAQPGRFTKQQFIEFLKVARYENEGYALLSYDDFHGRENFSDPMRSELVNLAILPRTNEVYDCSRYDQIKNTVAWLQVLPDPENTPIEFFADDAALPASKGIDNLIGLLTFTFFHNLEAAIRVVEHLYRLIQVYGISLNQCLGPKGLGTCWKTVEQVVGKETAMTCLTDFYTSVCCYDLHGSSLRIYVECLYDHGPEAEKVDPEFTLVPDKTISEMREIIETEHNKKHPYRQTLVKGFYTEARYSVAFE